MQIAYQIFSSPVGEILVAGTEFAITHVVRGTDRNQLSSDFMLTHDIASALGGRTDYLREACEAILNYLEGRSTRIDLAVQLDGTEFQRKVWHQLRQIPYGVTVSYSELAEKLGTPDAFRAVATACGANPVPVIIPCHRVIHKNGDTSGFVWGEEAKAFLLNLEKQHSPATAAALA